MSSEQKSIKHIKPFIKWAGGKEKELIILQKYFPKRISRFIEPFVGGGSVFLNTVADSYYVNDKSKELITLYLMIKKQNKTFFRYLNAMASAWKKIELFVIENEEELIELYKSATAIDINTFVEKHEKSIQDLSIIKNQDCSIMVKEAVKNLQSKIKRARKIEIEKGRLSQADIVDNMECALKSAFYMYLRQLYNSLSLFENEELYSAVFYFIREYCYSSMFRYNTDGEFNVPYGGISYNKKDFSEKIKYIHSKKLTEKLSCTNFSCNDFEVFFQEFNLSEEDFIFLDPPYDSDFSTYAKNTFDKSDQIRLCDSLKTIKAKFLLVIKETDFIKNLYSDFNIISFQKHYLVSFKNRNDKDVTHLIITNYKEAF